MKKLIKFLVILGRKIPVKKADLSHLNAAGLYDPVTKTIHIDKSINKKDYLMETILHELGHAVFDRGSLNQTISRELEEVIVDQIAVAISENFHLKAKNI